MAYLIIRNFFTHSIGSYNYSNLNKNFNFCTFNIPTANLYEKYKKFRKIWLFKRT